MKKLLILTLALILIAPSAYSASDWVKLRPLSTEAKLDFPADSQENNEALDRLLQDYREGMKISYSSATTVSVAAGQVVCSNAGETLRQFRANTSATSVTFANIDTGAEAASKTYYVYADCDADAATATFSVSLSTSAPDGATYYKRLGSFYNNADSNIVDGETIVNDNNYYGLVLGDWVSKSTGTSYLASTDGFFVGILHLASAADATLTALSDASNPPTTERGGDFIWATSAHTGSLNNTISSFCIPVKKGDYYKATWSVTGGSPTSSVYWIPSE